MPYALTQQISKKPLDGGIEITEQQYIELRDFVLSGGEFEVIDDEIVMLSSEKRTVYSTENGEEQKIPENKETPDGFTDIDRPSFLHVWNDGWVIDNDLFKSQLKLARDNLWRSSTITLSNNAILKVNDRTRSDVSDTYDGLMAAGLTEYAGWRAENGVYTMTLELFQESKVLALQVVGKAFSAFNTVIDTHTETPYTSLQDAVDAMTALFEEE